MVRVKMPLKLIEGERHRNTTFMKRRAVLKKKAMELGVLCDIVTLLVCFGPRGQLETWPEDPQEVRRIIDQYYWSLTPKKCVKHRYDIASFLKGHVKRQQAELDRERNFWLDGPHVTEESLEVLAQSLDEKLAAIEKRIGHLCLEKEKRGKEIEVWGELLQSHPQHTLEDMPPLAGGLPLDAILDAQPIRSFEGFDLSRVKPERFRGKCLRGHAATAAAAAPGGAPHGLQRSEMPCTLPHSTPDTYMLPLITDQSFSQDMSYLDYLDYPITSGPYPSMDFLTCPAAARTCALSAVDTLDPSMTASSLSFCRYASLGFSGGCTTSVIPSSNVNLFDQSVDTEYGFSLHRLPASNPAVMCNDAYHQNELCGAEFFQAGHTASHSLAVTWSASIFLDVPPTCFSGSDNVQAIAPSGDDSSKLVATPASYPYAYTYTERP